MNHKSIEVVKEIYKPYKYQIKKNAHILESTSGKIVLKEKKNDIEENIWFSFVRKDWSNMFTINNKNNSKNK